jgi:hypothetical protein
MTSGRKVKFCMTDNQTLINTEKFIVGQTQNLNTQEEILHNFRRLFARCNHVMHERSFFGILDDDLDSLIWSSGGNDIASLLNPTVTSKKPILTFTALLNAIGIDDTLRQEIQEDMSRLGDGATMSFIKRLPASQGKTFSIMFAHRENEPVGAIQFTLYDISPFIETEYSVRAMASYVIKQMENRDNRAVTDLVRLANIHAGITALPDLQSDTEVQETSSNLYKEVETLAFRTIEILRDFETTETGTADATGAPISNHDMPNALPMHTRNFGNWETLMARAQDIAEGRASLSNEETHHLYFADSFIRNALPVMIHISTEGNIFILNGSKRGETYTDVDVMIRDIGVEENSRRSANDFFSSRQTATTILSINNENFEVSGLLTSDGNWQAMIFPAMTASIDVRGMFHAFKNLLLNLQVLYVIKTTSDARNLSATLNDTLASIYSRIETLRHLATHGRISRLRTLETVEKWLNVTNRFSGTLSENIHVTGLDRTAHIAFMATPGEMEDTLAEIIQNAIAHDAVRISIALTICGQRLAIAITDDGVGVSGKKLEQIRTVLETRLHDPDLTSRADGSGNGLLGAANVMSHFVGGMIKMDHNPTGKGTRVEISMNMSNDYRQPDTNLN